ncbi:MAG: pyridoxal phosphate-dependent aminotransferase [candidate division WOR-3 bacterium]|nr:pyridoxal phosphate-dependent aminotransferase [candidate division WOR-3 bacterium]
MMNKYMDRLESPAIVQIKKSITEKQKDGVTVLDLTQAIVDILPKLHYEELTEHLGDIQTHLYTPDAGKDQLREQLSLFFKKQWDYRAGPGNIFITPGANNAYFSLMIMLMNTGSRMLIPLPYYFNHSMTVDMLGGENVFCDFTYESIISNMADIDMITIVSPNNPSGKILNSSHIEAIVREAERQGKYVIIDETYALLRYGDNYSALSIIDRYRNLFVVGSFSKSVPMAGWRLGYTVMHQSFAEHFLKVMDCNVICASTVSQIALLDILSALDKNAERVNEILIERRNALIEYMDIEESDIPNAACFLWLPVDNDREFASKLLDSHSIGVIAGSYFGKEGFVRISYGSTDTDNLRNAGRIIESMRN